MTYFVHRLGNFFAKVLKISALGQKTSKDISPTFCLMPWTNLATETNGKCKICCVVMTNRYIQDENEQDFLIQKNEIKDIWNSKYLRNLRKQMLNGEWPVDCSYCQNQEKVGNHSSRESYNERWWSTDVENRVEESMISDGHVSGYPTSIEPRPGITCDLKCNTCWSLSSSKMFSERKEALNNNPELPLFLQDSWKYEIEEAEKSDFKWSENSIYHENFRKCISGLRRLYFTGGEPTLIKANINSLKEILATGQKDTLVSYTTNLNFQNSELLDLSLKFTYVDILGSVDGLGPANEFIRFPSQWEIVKRNMLMLAAKSQKTKRIISNRRLEFSIMSVYQICNSFNLLELMDWASKLPELRNTRFLVTMLHSPPFLSPEILPERLKEKIFRRIDELLDSNDMNKDNKNELRKMKIQMQIKRDDQAELLRDFSQYIRFLDSVRKTNFKNTFPELAELIQS